MKEFIKDYILDNLANIKGANVYGSDLSHEIYEADNQEGYITKSKTESQENLQENMEYFSHTVEYYKQNFGEMAAGDLAMDLLRDPQKAECLMVFCYVDAAINSFLAHHQYKGRNVWDERITVDDDFIEWISENIVEAVNEGFEDMSYYKLED